MFQIQKQVSLRHLNTLALPAIAENFCKITSQDALCEALSWANKHQLPITVLGGGSNVVLARNFSGLVLQMAISGVELESEQQDHRFINIGAGENWHQLVRHTLDQGWYGLENLSLIPGLAGAAPIQNIGAYGVELSERFHSLEAIHMATGELRRMDLSDCQFGYRDSFFKGLGRDQYVITRICLQLSVQPNLCVEYPALKQVLMDDTGQLQDISPQQVSDAVCTIRQSKLPDPKDIPNAGSFFKNPVVGSEQVAILRNKYPDIVGYDQGDGRMKLAAGWLIEQAGWKGIIRAGVGVHAKQALVLVNYSGSGDDILSLASDIQASVLEKFGLEIEVEPRIYR
jgi:UDP-N-acetylmuramate dehydrogenase